MLRVGHKGADAIRPGNTVESFEAAVDVGVDAIEFDVLSLRDSRVVLAHDYADAERRRPLSLDEGLDAFTRPPLDTVQFDCDVKLPGPEEQLADALRERGLMDRAMISTMELSTLEELREIAPELRRGWTYPKVERDWASKRWAKPGVYAAGVYARRQFPRLAERMLEDLGVRYIWLFHSFVSRRLLRVAHDADVRVIAWTVDDPARMRALRDLGVDGIVTNDPRLFAEL